MHFESLYPTSLGLRLWSVAAVKRTSGGTGGLPKCFADDGPDSGGLIFDRGVVEAVSRRTLLRPRLTFKGHMSETGPRTLRSDTRPIGWVCSGQEGKG